MKQPTAYNCRINAQLPRKIWSLKPYFSFQVTKVQNKKFSIRSLKCSIWIWRTRRAQITKLWIKLWANRLEKMRLRNIFWIRMSPKLKLSNPLRAIPAWSIWQLQLCFQYQIIEVRWKTSRLSCFKCSQTDFSKTTNLSGS